MLYSTNNVDERTDHLGNIFETKNEMCKQWGVSTNIYNIRIKRNWTKERALTLKPQNHSAEERTDHLGQVFNSINEMCKQWNLSFGTYNDRISNGYSKKDALTTISRTQCTVEERTDHLGQVFNSINEMCRHWGIKPGAYYSRIKAGYSKKDALTTISRTQCTVEERTDHLGQVFNSINEMCRHWNIGSCSYYSRIKAGYSKKDALTTISRTQSNVEKRTDHLGQVFNSINEMCDHWGISFGIYQNRNNAKYSKEESLGIIKLINKRISNYNITSNLLIIKFAYASSEDILYFKCRYNDELQILPKDEIIRILRAERGS